MDLTGVPSAEKISRWLDLNEWTRVGHDAFQAPQCRPYSSRLGRNCLLVKVPSGDHQIDVAQRVLALATIAEAHGLQADGLAEFISQADFTVELAHLEMDRQLTEPRGNAQYRASVGYQRRLREEGLVMAGDMILGHGYELALPEKKPLPRDGLRLDKMENGA